MKKKSFLAKMDFAPFYSHATMCVCVYACGLQHHLPSYLVGGDKPCTSIKFPYEDQTRRHYNGVLLSKIVNILEGNLEELEERIRCGLPRTRKLLKRFLGDVCHSCSLFIDLSDGRKTGTHLGKNRFKQLIWVRVGLEWVQIQ